jgi:hypothetical protein
MRLDAMKTDDAMGGWGGEGGGIKGSRLESMMWDGAIMRAKNLVRVGS